MMNKLNILDCTFRDGGYYNNWDFDKITIEKYINSIITSNVDYVEIFHRVAFWGLLHIQLMSL